MDFIVLLTLLGIISSTAISFYVLHKNPLEKLNSRFFVMGILFLIWGAGVLLRYDAKTPSAAYFSYLFTMLGAQFVPGAIFDFSQQFLRSRLSDKTKGEWLTTTKNIIWIFLCLLYFVLASPYAYKNSFLADGHYVVEHNLFYFIVLGIDIIIILFSCLIVAFYSKFNFTNARHKAQAYIIASSPVIPALIIFMIELSAAVMKKNAIYEPYGVICAFLLCMGYGMIKFDIIQITPENSATNIIKYLPDGLVLCNNEGLILHANPAFLENFKEESERILNNPIARFVFFDKELSSNNADEILKESLTLDKKLYLKTGFETTPPLFGVVSKPVIDNDKCQLGYIMVFRDLGPILTLQMELYHSSKMANLGEIAAGVAHEINNPLAIIKGYINILNSTLQEKGQGNEEITDSINRLNNSVERIAKIVKSLKSYSRSVEKNVVMELVNIHAVIELTLSLIQSVYQSVGIKIVTQLSKEPLLVYGNSGYLQQVFINIFSHAKASFLPKGGTITLHETIEGGWITIDIRDNGCGISPKNLSQIFNAFFTTKSPSEGVEFGLSISQNMMQEMGGKINVVSTEGEGSCFSLILRQANNQA